MKLTSAEMFTLRALLVDVGIVLTDSVLDQANCLDREETGAGFLSTVELPAGVLGAAAPQSVSKTLRDVESGQLFLLDLFIRDPRKIDLEGATLSEAWPKDFDGARLVELGKI